MKSYLTSVNQSGTPSNYSWSEMYYDCNEYKNIVDFLSINPDNRGAKTTSIIMFPKYGYFYTSAAGLYTRNMAINGREWYYYVGGSGSTEGLNLHSITITNTNSNITAILSEYIKGVQEQWQYVTIQYCDLYAVD